MRRLPIFFVLDCSESMVGENLKKMNDGLQMIVNDLRRDPHALETAWISIIAFAGIAKTIVPLTEIVSFYPPQLPIGGGTSLGSALKELSHQIDTQVQKTTLERKGDWKPVVYLLTDGRPTDNVAPEIQRWKEKYSAKVNLIAIGLGASADLNILSQLTENVLLFTEAEKGDFTKFIKWITASVVSQSRSVGDEPPPLLDKTQQQVVRLAKDEAARNYDDTCVTFIGRCNHSKRPYLIKYECPLTNVPNLNFKLNLNNFNLTGCYAIDENYFTWSDSSVNVSQVNTSELHGTPGCPWCVKGVSFSESNDDSNFDVTRGKG